MSGRLRDVVVRAAGVFAVATLAVVALGACAAPTVQITSRYEDETRKQLIALFVVIADDAKINPDKIDPALRERPLAHLDQLIKSGSFEVLLQFKPEADARGHLAWELKQRLPATGAPNVIVKANAATHLCEDPLTVKIDNALLELDPETAVLLVARFRVDNDEKAARKFLGKERIATKETFAFDVREQKILDLK